MSPPSYQRLPFHAQLRCRWLLVVCALATQSFGEVCDVKMKLMEIVRENAVDLVFKLIPQSQEAFLNIISFIIYTVSCKIISTSVFLDFN